MTFEEFKQEVKDNIKDYLPVSYQDAEVTINEVIKNNDTHLSGLTVRTEEYSIAPTLYLEDFYNAYENGDHSLEGVMVRIAETYDNAAQNGLDADVKDVVNQITDYEATKDKIIPRIVNREANEERLKGMPHTDVGNDLAVTYHVELGNDEGGQMSVAVSNQMMENYGVSVGELHEQACQNMQASPANFESIAETLAHLMIPGYDEMSLEEKAVAREGFDMPDPGMYVLTNESKVFGAAEMLDPATMDTITEQVGEFYILPSSVHEVLIVPKREDMNLSDLEAMVQEVNSTQVAPNEVLSDHVYEYDSETKEIYRADKAEEHMKAKEASKAEKSEKSEKTEKTAEKRPSLKAKLEEKKKEVSEKSKDHKELTKERTQSIGGRKHE